jgi:AcrR family transcriptional regulator
MRRRLIVDAAREVIASQGLAATRMRDVAAAAEVSLGTLTYHFAGVNDLLASVIATEDAEFALPVFDRALSAPTGREGLRRLVDGLLNDEPRTRQHWVVWMDFWTLANRDQRYGRWQANTYNTWREVLTELVTRGDADGSLVVTNVELAVTQLMVLTDGVAAQAYLIGREPARAIESPGHLMWMLVAEMFAFPPDAVHASTALPVPASART